MPSDPTPGNLDARSKASRAVLDEVVFYRPGWLDEPAPTEAEDAQALAADAIERVSEQFATDPTEQTMRDAVEEHLTDDPEANELILEYAANTLTLLRAAQQDPQR